jgi:hypothetical protein
MSAVDSEHVQERVEALLRRRLGAHLCEVRVLARDGCVILQGRAFSYYTKQLAQHVVMQEMRLPVAANQIEVRRSAPDAGSADQE